MGLTQKLGTIPLAIQTDSSNNVGIGGAANASYKLAVTGASLFTGALTASTTFTLDGTKKVFLRSNQSTGGGLLSGSAIGAMGNFSIYSDDGVAGDILGMYYWNGGTYRSALQFANVSSGSSNLLLMKDGGNVGIGTSSPGTKLDVVGTTRTSGTFNAYDGTRDVYLNPGADFGLGALPAVQVASNHGLQFATNNGLAMFITAGRNIGIGPAGTASNAVRLVVQGSDATSSNYSFIATNNAGATLIGARNDGLIDLGTRTNSPYNYNATFSPRSCVLDAAGNIGYSTSTKESKTNIQQISDVSWLYQLNPVSFNYRKKDDENNYTDEAQDERWYGLIADEVESINQDLVFYNINEDGSKTLAGVEYTKLISVLVKSVQELSAKVTALENK